MRECARVCVCLCECRVSVSDLCERVRRRIGIGRALSRSRRPGRLGMKARSYIMFHIYIYKIMVKIDNIPNVDNIQAVRLTLPTTSA